MNVDGVGEELAEHMDVDSVTSAAEAVVERWELAAAFVV
jgi:hypothetical protein